MTAISMFSPCARWVFGPLSPVTGVSPAASARTLVSATPLQSAPSPPSKPASSRSTTVTGNAKRRCVAIRVARGTPADPVVPANLPALLLRPRLLLLLPHLLLRRPGLRKTRTSPLLPPSPSLPAPTPTPPAGSPPRSINVGWTISSVSTAGRKATELRTVP